jgi:dienelactone hydrolase
LWLHYPNTSDASQTFPLLVHAHGVLGGGLDLLGYAEHFQQLASFGFIVAATFSCNTGCTDKSMGAPWSSCAGLLPLQPEGQGWGPYYAELLKMIDFARNSSSSDAIFSRVNWAAGVGILGHSMGGQAAAVAAGAACTEQWGIKAAVLHHPATGDIPGGNVGSNMSVPVAGFTSSGDKTGCEASTEQIMAAARVRPAAYRDLVGWSHLEPVLWPPAIENPLLATMTAAWFNVFLKGDTGYWYNMVFGNSSDSLCTYAPMVICYAEPQ